MNVEELLKETLAKDETVKWTATPKAYSIMNGENKKSTIRFWIVATVLLIVLNFAYIALCVSDDSVTFMPGVLVATVGIPLFLFINPLRDERHISKQLLVVTDKRAIVFHKSNKELSVPLDAIDTVRVEASSDDAYRHVLIGAAAGAPARKLRNFAIVGVRDDDDKCVGLVFYHLDAHESERACALLRPNAAPQNAV